MDEPRSAADYYRFCPGEEQVKISNAICRGRRRSSFPKCKGCRFNDDEQAARPGAPALEKAQTLRRTEALFRPFDICGPVPDILNEDVAWRIGHAAAQYLRSKLRGYERAHPAGRSLAIGHDQRPNARTIQQALIDGVRAAGLHVFDLGAIDTPGLVFAVNHLGAGGGLQVTGGRLPMTCLSILLCGARAVPITAETGLTSIGDIALRVPRHVTGSQGDLTAHDTGDAYIAFLRGRLRAGGTLPRPMTVVVDFAHGPAARTLPQALGDLSNLKLLILRGEPDPPPDLRPDPFNPENTRELRNLVREHKADFGVAFDSDASSCCFFDERGQSVRPDRLAGLLARMFIGREPGATIVLDHRSTRAAVEEIQRVGGTAVPCRADRVSLKKLMLERNAPFGADLEGRFHFRDASNNESAPLAVVHVLNLLVDHGRKLGDLLRPLHRYGSPGELRLPCRRPDHVLRELAAAHAAAELDTLDGLSVKYPDWWFHARVAPPLLPPAAALAASPAPAPATPILSVLLEARSRKLADARLAELRAFIHAADADAR